MKAIRVHQFGGPEVLALEEIPIPTPAAGEVLIRVHAVGVNPVETYLRSGSNPTLARPYTPGSDCAGVVVGVGSGVTRVKTGDRVFTSDTITGSYAEFTLASEERAHHFPDRLSFAEAAAIPIPYATAYRALWQRGAARAGETVLVHGGSGSVGLASIQMARAAGLKVFATGGTEEGRDQARREGAHFVFDHHAPDYLQDLLRLTEGRGVDLILEMLSNINLGRDLTVLAPRGRVVVIGSRGKVEINPRDTMSREVDIRGLHLFMASPEDRRTIYAGIASGLENRTLRPIVSLRFSLAQAAEAHREILSLGSMGKIVLEPLG